MVQFVEDNAVSSSSLGLRGRGAAGLRREAVADLYRGTDHAAQISEQYLDLFNRALLRFRLDSG